MVVSPDVGGVARARAFAKKLNDAPLAIVDKRRSAHNVSEVMNLIGDVRGKVGRRAERRAGGVGGDAKQRWGGCLGTCVAAGRLSLALTFLTCCGARSSQ